MRNVRPAFAALVLIGALASCSHSNVAPVPGVFFPVFKTAPGADAMYADALSSGVLEDRNGCLEVGDSLVIWPYGSTLRRGQDGVLEVLTDQGKVGARVGWFLALGGWGGGGKGATQGAEDQIGVSIPTKCATGVYWHASPLDSLSSPQITSGLPLTALAVKALDMSKANDEPNPTSMKAVVTDSDGVSALMNGVPATHGPSEPVTLVQTTGSFDCNQCKSPTNGATHGTALWFETALGSKQVTDWGISPTAFDLSKLGQPIDLSKHLTIGTH